MKRKTHSGSKKRFKLLKSGKVKRSKANRRHMLEARSPKRKRHSTKATYVHSANMDQMKRLLVF